MFSARKLSLVSANKTFMCLSVASSILKSGNAGKDLPNPIVGSLFGQIFGASNNTNRLDFDDFGDSSPDDSWSNGNNLKDDSFANISDGESVEGPELPLI